MGDVTHHHRHGNGAEEVGIAPVRREEAIMLPGRAPAENVRGSRLARRCPIGRGGRAGGSHRIAKYNAKG